MPLRRRVPKFGFTNPNRVSYKGINLDVISQLAETKKIEIFTPEVFAANGLAAKKELIKILGRGEISGKFQVSAHGFSATAKAAIEAKGGEITEISTLKVAKQDD